MAFKLSPEKESYNSNCRPGAVELTGHVSSKVQRVEGAWHFLRTDASSAKLEPGQGGREGK